LSVRWRTENTGSAAYGHQILGEPTMTNQITDPVCGMQVDATQNALEYKGVNYSFCSAHCRKKFSDEPEKYASEAEAK
jgi:YHS domain-containing protein